MKEAMFTPGPWTVGGKFGTRVLVGENVLSDMWNIPGPGGVDEGKANAHLIAAAPDMYEALEAAILEYGKPGGPWNVPSSPGTWIDKAKAAIVKARGEL